MKVARSGRSVALSGPVPGEPRGGRRAPPSRLGGPRHPRPANIRAPRTLLGHGVLRNKRPVKQGLGPWGEEGGAGSFSEGSLFLTESQHRSVKGIITEGLAPTPRDPPVTSVAAPGAGPGLADERARGEPRLSLLPGGGEARMRASSEAGGGGGGLRDPGRARRF